MILEKSFQLTLPEPPERLLEPERVFGGRAPFGRLERQGDQLVGELVAEVPLLGEIQFPFVSRMELGEEGRAYLHADSPVPGYTGPAGRSEGEPPAPGQQRAELPDPRFWVELSGEGQVVPGGIAYSLNLRIHAALPEGEKWGGKALRRMAEAAFERTVGRTLETLGTGKLLRG